MGVELDTLEVKVESSAEQASAGIDKLTATLKRLKDITKGGVGLATVANQLSKLNTALSSINVHAGKVGEIGSALQKLSAVQKASGLTSVVNTLKKLPAVTKELETANLNKFASQMERVASAVRPLANEMQKVSNGFAAFPIRIQKIISSNTGLAASNHQTAKSFGVMGTGISSLQAKFGIYAAVFRRVANVMAGWLVESNDYVENLNLFTVAMGEGAQAAYDYAHEVKEALGIDPSEWMRNQGVFKQITSGFGVVQDKANLMSKNLTQIGYDISSFFNISIEESMQKVQSGIAGELEPLRRLGYALDQATLQELAYKHGIDMKITAMTQAQKSQLRYLAIMQQSGNVMGDMARTITTPANAMRILNQQITQLRRALGNLLIPAISAILPYVQAFVELLTEAIQRLAVLVGFELPKIDYSNLGGLTGGAESAGDALDNAAEKAKKLKSYTMGFDELNVISESAAAGSGTGTGAGLGGDLGIELPEYDFLAGLKEQTDKVKKSILDFFKEWEGTIKTVAALLAGLWAVGKIKKFVTWAKAAWDVLRNTSVVRTAVSLWNAFADGFSLLRSRGAGFFSSYAGGLRNMGYSMSTLQKAVGAVIALGAEFLVVSNRTKELTLGNISLENALFSIIGTTALVGTAMYAMFDTFGIVLTVITAVVAAVVGFNQAQDEMRAAMVEATFFDGQGIAIDALAEGYTSLMQATVDARQPIIDAWDTIESGRGRIQDTTTNIANLANQITLGYTTASETLPLMAEEFDALYQDTYDVLHQEADLIYQSLAGSTGEALEAMGYNLNEVGLMVSSVVNDTTLEMERLKQENENLLKSIESGTADGGAFKRYLENAQKIADMSGVDTSGLDTFRDKVMNLIPDDIDWGDTDGLKQIFSDISTATNEATGAISESSDSLIKAVEHMQSLAAPEDFQVFQSIIDALKKDKESKIAEIESIATDFVGGLQTNLITSVQDEVNAAMENWDSLSWLAKTFKYGGNKDQYIKEALTDYQNNIVTPITNDMKSAFTKTLGEDSVWAETVMSTLLDNLFSKQGVGSYQAGGKNYYTGYATTFAGNVEEAISAVLPESMRTAAMNAMSGFSGGIVENTKLVEDAMHGVTAVIMAVPADDLDMHSPSVVMTESGGNVPAGMALGITNNLGLVDEAMGQMTDTIITASSEKDWKQVGKTLAESIIAGLKQNANGTAYANALTASVKTGFGINGEKSTVFSGIGNALGTGLKDAMASAKSSIMDNWSKLPQWFRDNVNTKLLSDFRGAMNSVKSASIGALTAPDGIKPQWMGLPGWFLLMVNTPLATGFSSTTAGITTAFKNARTDTETAWNGLGEWFDVNVMTPLREKITREVFAGIFKESIVGGLEDITEDVKSASGALWNAIQSALGKAIQLNFSFGMDNIGGGTGGSVSSSGLKFSQYPVSQGFGHKGHKGIDFAAPMGTPVQSPVSGVVAISKDLTDSYGRHVVIADGMGNFHYLAHLSKRLVPAGAMVSRGALVGISGSTGKSSGPHVHYEVRRGNRYSDQVNPIKFLASGGFAEVGQLFLAREAGPELVGTMGGKSTVANNDQIVSGIRAGVAEANAEQNALLRRQNEILLELLKKEGGVYLDGKQLKKAYDKAAREQGAIIMSGGVMG